MEYDLINTIVISIVSAFVCGLIAQKAKLSPIVGYLVAGVIVGPFTPGFVADSAIAKQLAEIGIILLMFGVGLHFSLSDLIRVQKISLPGAVFQMSVAISIGAGVMWLFGFDWVAGLIYGLCLSVASTVVLLRTLEQRRLIDTEVGKIAIGWLLVEDLVMVLALVLFPVLAQAVTSGVAMESDDIFRAILIVIVKIALFAFVMVFFGRKILPGILVTISKTKSAELTTLGTLAIALGFAYVAYSVFDASFALGAFFAGLVLSESDIGLKAAEKSLPMRDAFAVLFFVSVGMLFDPMTLVESPLMIIITLMIIVAGKIMAALAITHLFRQSRETSYIIAVSLAQIGEFSFILAGLGLSEGLMSQEIYNLVLAGALFSIALNPFLFRQLDKYHPGAIRGSL